MMDATTGKRNIVRLALSAKASLLQRVENMIMAGRV